MKKIISLLLIVLIVVSSVGCASDLVDGQNSTTTNNVAEKSDKPLVYATIYPVYALTQAVGGDLINLEAAVPFGVDPHDFKPSAKLIGVLEEADIIFYNGLAMEPWLDKIKGQLEDKGVKLVNLSEVVELITFDHDYDHEDHDNHQNHSDKDDHDNKDNHDSDAHEHGDYDPHIWLDPVNATAMVQSIYETLREALQEEGEGPLFDNYNAVKKELYVIDDNYQAVLKWAERRELVVGHAAFGYLCHRYKLKQIAIAGLSTHDEPSAALLAEISDLAKEHDVKVIFYDATGSDKLAKVIAEEIGVELKPLNPLGTLTNEQYAAGEDYFSLMRQNLSSLIAALLEKE